jgi:hypothetical protein
MKHSRLAESFFGKYPNNFKLKHKIKSQEIVHHNWWIPSPFSDDRDHPVCRSRSIPPIITTFKFRYFYLFRFLSSLTFRNEMRKIEKSDNQITTCLKKKRKRDQLFYLVWFLPWWFVIVIIDTFKKKNLKPAQQFCYCVYWRNQLVSVGLHQQGRRHSIAPRYLRFGWGKEIPDCVGFFFRGKWIGKIKIKTNLLTKLWLARPRFTFSFFTFLFFLELEMRKKPKSHRFLLLLLLLWSESEEEEEEEKVPSGPFQLNGWPRGYYQM